MDEMVNRGDTLVLHKLTECKPWDTMGNNGCLGRQLNLTQHINGSTFLPWLHVSQLGRLVGFHNALGHDGGKVNRNGVPNELPLLCRSTTKLVGIRKAL